MKILTMMTAIACLLANSLSFAQLVKRGTVDVYEISLESEKPLKFTLSNQFETNDGCNHFSILGDLRKLEIPEGQLTILQDFVAEVGISGTEMGCADGPKRVLNLESQEFVIYPVGGSIYGKIYVPTGFKINVK
jgi:hypothetical protein